MDPITMAAISAAINVGGGLLSGGGSDVPSGAFVPGQINTSNQPLGPEGLFNQFFDMFYGSDGRERLDLYRQKQAISDEIAYLHYRAKKSTKHSSKYMRKMNGLRDQLRDIDTQISNMPISPYKNETVSGGEGEFSDSYYGRLAENQAYLHGETQGFLDNMQQADDRASGYRGQYEGLVGGLIDDAQAGTGLGTPIKLSFGGSKIPGATFVSRPNRQMMNDINTWGLNRLETGQLPNVYDDRNRHLRELETANTFGKLDEYGNPDVFFPYMQALATGGQSMPSTSSIGGTSANYGGGSNKPSLLDLLTGAISGASAGAGLSGELSGLLSGLFGDSGSGVDLNDLAGNLSSGIMDNWWGDSGGIFGDLLGSLQP